MNSPCTNTVSPCGSGSCDSFYHDLFENIYHSPSTDIHVSPGADPWYDGRDPWPSLWYSHSVGTEYLEHDAVVAYILSPSTDKLVCCNFQYQYLENQLQLVFLLTMYKLLACPKPLPALWQKRGSLDPRRSQQRSPNGRERVHTRRFSRGVCASLVLKWLASLTITSNSNYLKECECIHSVCGFDWALTRPLVFLPATLCVPSPPLVWCP